MTYGDRLKKVRKKLGLTQDELAKSIGLKNKQTISDIENGKQQKLSAKHELHFCEKYHIDIFWLQRGEVDTSVKNKSSIDNWCVEEPDMGYNSTIKLPYYPKEYVNVNSGSYPYLKNTQPISFNKKFLELHLGLSDYKDIFIIDCVGESMEPTFKNGTLLFVNPIENEGGKVRDNNIYMMICDTTIVIKRIAHNPIDKTYTLISDNIVLHNDITTTNLEESGCQLIGRIIGSLDRA